MPPSVPMWAVEPRSRCLGRGVAPHPILPHGSIYPSPILSRAPHCSLRCRDLGHTRTPHCHLSSSPAARLGPDTLHCTLPHLPLTLHCPVADRTSPYPSCAHTPHATAPRQNLRTCLRTARTAHCCRRFSRTRGMTTYLHSHLSLYLFSTTPLFTRTHRAPTSHTYHAHVTRTVATAGGAPLRTVGSARALRATPAAAAALWTALHTHYIATHHVPCWYAPPPHTHTYTMPCLRCHPFTLALPSCYLQCWLPPLRTTACTDAGRFLPITPLC